MPKPHGGKLIERIIKGKRKERLLKEAEEIEKITVEKGVAADIENIAKGVYSPLEGFMTREELETVLHLKRLPNDIPWTLPILLDLPKDLEGSIKEGDDVTLTYRESPLAIMHIDEIYPFNKKEIAEYTFETTDEKHPGVAKVYRMAGKFIAGKIDLIDEPEGPYDRYKLSPKETRYLFRQKGWKTIVGFQTRNPPHLGHEYLQKTALTFLDGVFINPVIGTKKKGDFKDEVILQAYEILIERYYLKNHAVLAILPYEMRYAGPREAVHHAIMRKNFGCTHFIVGRDHAGVGNYYKPYAAQEIFEEFPDLGIAPLFFKTFFYCRKCGGITHEKACPHSDEYRLKFSGTRIREILRSGKLPPRELMRPEIAEVIIKNPNPFVE
ncbi:sulfate adenylyltransferase [Candidatus Bathyarchaeota archaeon]|nr:MAG: sulfate adenylyltransferase [Candidatus Bathyarchaeota archaeon]